MAFWFRINKQDRNVFDLFSFYAEFLILRLSVRLQKPAKTLVFFSAFHYTSAYLSSGSQVKNTLDVSIEMLYDN